MTQKKKAIIIVGIFIVIFVVVVGIVFGLDYYRKKTIEVLNADMLQVSAQINSSELTNSELEKSVSELEKICDNRLVSEDIVGQAQMFIAIARLKEQINDLKDESSILNSNFNKAVSSGNEAKINSAMNDIWSFSYRTTVPDSPILKSMQGMVVYGQFNFNKELIVRECIQPLFDNVNKYLKSVGQYN